SLAGTTPNAIPTLKDPKFWTAEKKKTRKIDRLARSLLIQGILNDIYSLIDSNDTAKDLWDALERKMYGSEYGEQDRKAAILYEYETFKATKGEQLLDTYLHWKQYGTLMRQTKNLIDINIDALYNILKQNQGDVNDDLGYKKKSVVVTSISLALVAKKTKVSKRKEKVKVQTEFEGSDDDDISDLKKITTLLAKAFNRKKYYAKPTNNNLRTSSASSLTNRKPEYVKSVEKKEDKKVDEKKRDMSKVKCYNCKKEGHFSISRKQRRSMQIWSSWLKLRKFFQIQRLAHPLLMTRLLRDFVHFQDLDTFSSVRRPKHNGVIWKKKGSSNTSNVDLSSVSHSKLNKDVKRYSRKDLLSCNRALLTNCVEKSFGMVRFGNNDFAMIAGYGDVVIGSMMIKKVYYVEGLGHNLFSVGKFCDK
nr:integrase, catalytic region, zinc finger, CCHC-type, peptidase aspartic, catalytic [Tanacetum cinerariifolium]